MWRLFSTSVITGLRPHPLAGKHPRDYSLLAKLRHSDPRGGLVGTTSERAVIGGSRCVRGLLGGGWPDRRVCGTAEAVCDAGARTALLCSLHPPNQHPIQPGTAPPSGRLPAAWHASRRYQAAQQPELPGLKCSGQIYSCGVRSLSGDPSCAVLRGIVTSYARRPAHAYTRIAAGAVSLRLHRPGAPMLVCLQADAFVLRTCLVHNLL